MSETRQDEAEARLAAFWRQDGLADHDAAFSLAVMQRLAQRRLRGNLLTLAGVMGLAALVLGALAPWLGELAARLAGRASDAALAFGPAAVVLVVVVSVIVIAGPPAGLRGVVR